ETAPGERPEASFPAKVNLARERSRQSQSRERPASSVPEKINLAREGSRQNRFREALFTPKSIWRGFFPQNSIWRASPSEKT
ncbi:MAG: hypothetical protein J6S63_11155, partial [Atopobiaceae bacterium]|nr:hypothetical protein [Atopobiaceae bacterium]